MTSPREAFPLVFEAEDFQEIDRLLAPNHTSTTLIDLVMTAAAKEANAKLKEWLEQAPRAWKCNDNGIQTLHLAKPCNATHSALLVNIQPIEKDTQDQFVRDWLACCDLYASQVREGPFQKFVERAKKLLEAADR